MNLHDLGFICKYTDARIYLFFSNIICIWIYIVFIVRNTCFWELSIRYKRTYSHFLHFRFDKSSLFRQSLFLFIFKIYNFFRWYILFLIWGVKISIPANSRIFPKFHPNLFLHLPKFIFFSSLFVLHPL